MLYEHIKKTISDLGYASFTLETVSFILNKAKPWEASAFNELYFVQSVLNPVDQKIIPLHVEASNIQECLRSDVLLPKFYATYYTGQIKCYLPEDASDNAYVYVNFVRCVPYL